MDSDKKHTKFTFKDEYECGELKVYKLGHSYVAQQEIKLPDHYEDILKAKKRMENLIQKCECGEIGTSHYVRIKTHAPHKTGLVEYLDYTIQKCLCRKCYERYYNYEKFVDVLSY